MTIAYRADDPVSSRWAGLNRKLTNFEIDYNFYQHETRLTVVEAAITVTVSIGEITQPTPTTLLFTMTDSSTQGPFTLPTATFQDRGTWQPSTAYLVNDTFTANGALYRVLFDHTSSSGSFDPNANDGAGHDYYAVMLSSPGNSLPSGGAAGMAVAKNSGTDFDYGLKYILPSTGSAKQVVMRTGTGPLDYNCQFVSAADVAFSPSTGSELTATNVRDALEQAAALGGGGGSVSAPDVSYTPPTGSSLTATNVSAAIHQLEVLAEGKGENDLGAFSGTILVPSNNYSVVTFTPNGATSLDNSFRSNKVGHRITVIITTSGTSSYNISFSAGDFVGQGTLATGTVDAKKYILDFVSDSAGILYETSRVGPL